MTARPTEYWQIPHFSPAEMSRFFPAPDSRICESSLYPILPSTVRDARYTSDARFVNVKPPWFLLPHRAPFSSESKFCHSIYHRELISVQRAPHSIAFFFRGCETHSTQDRPIHLRDGRYPFTRRANATPTTGQKRASLWSQKLMPWTA